MEFWLTIYILVFQGTQTVLQIGNFAWHCARHCQSVAQILPLSPLVKGQVLPVVDRLTMVNYEV